MKIILSLSDYVLHGKNERCGPKQQSQPADSTELNIQIFTAFHNCRQLNYTCKTVDLFDRLLRGGGTFSRSVRVR